MSDSMPNYKVEQQRLKMQRQAQLHNIERLRLEIMEMADRKRRHEENIVAAESAIAEIDQKMEQLAAAHGSLGDLDFEAARRSLDGG